MGSVLSCCHTKDMYKDVPDVWYDTKAMVEEKYEFGSHLGSGVYADVVMMRDKKTGLEVAAKHFSKRAHVEANTVMWAPEARALVEEVAILKLLNGRKNCMRLLGLVETPDDLWLLTEFCEQGDLMHTIEHRKADVTEAEGARWSSHILSAVAHCHANFVMHRDIKPENILVKGTEETCILGDFGSAVRWTSTEHFHEERGSSFWSAPETWAGDYDFRADNWSVGLIVLVIVDGLPSSEEIRLLHMANLKSAHAHSIKYEKKIHHPISDDLLDLLNGLLAKDPAKRLSASAALKTSKWLRTSEIETKTPTLTAARANAIRFNATAKVERALHLALRTLITSLQRRKLRDLLHVDQLLPANGNWLLVSVANLMTAVDALDNSDDVSKLKTILGALETTASIHIDLTLDEHLDKPAMKRNLTSGAIHTDEVDDDEHKNNNVDVIRRPVLGKEDSLFFSSKPQSLMDVTWPRRQHSAAV